LSLVLRNQVDKSPGTTAGIRTRDLLRLDTKPAAAPVHPRTSAAPKQTIEIIRGIQKTEAKLGVRELR
ncbi:MAG TPA: Flp pilus assembly protein CpaB, partial [Nitrosospira sp.]